MARFDVVGLGVAACDYVAQLDHYPARDEKARSEDFVMEGGGTVGTALVTAARLGLRAAFAGTVGEDDFGRFILDGLEKEDVDTSLARVSPGARSPFAFCVSVPPTRNVFSVRATTPPRALAPEELAALTDARYVHLDGSDESASLQLAEEARRRGVGVSLDLQRSSATTDRLLASADLAVVSASFARSRYAGKSRWDAVSELFLPNMQLAAITRGEDGCVATAGDEPFEIPAEGVKVVDSTGAGDVFHGALLVGMLAGQSTRKALELATHVAGLSCRALGGRAGIPRRDEIGGGYL